MALKHSEPTYNRPRTDSKTGKEMWARAPYNFVRLPEKVVTVDPPPDQSIYSGLTGWLDCEMVTRAPTYIRGMVTRAWMKQQAELRKEEADREQAWLREQKRTSLNERAAIDQREREQKLQAAAFFGMDGIPIIPGSSLRGMIRSIVEIISYSKIRWVGGEPTFSFRAVAAQNDDPLKEPYRSLIGPLAANVRAGYLERHGEEWFIVPSRQPSELGLEEKNGYLKVKERTIIASHLPGYIELNDSGYMPQIHRVRFDAQVRTDARGNKFTAVSAVGPRSSNLRYEGTLVCSGNMLETGRGGQRTRRNNQALVLEPAESKAIRVNAQAIEDYKLSLTPFQKEQLTAWGREENGCLYNGAPVFYVWTGREKEVLYFGHSPNFRVPIRLPGVAHASRPTDFVPEDLRADELIDIAGALFGWTPEPGSKRKDSCAGRLFFGDAKLAGSTENLWYSTEPIIPHVLSGPKATTFQHYLAQDRELGHDPDRKATLAHYGTPRTETQIRGRKVYWHRGSAPAIEANEKERQHERQLTRIQPLNTGVRFRFRVHFENLRDFELGALLWALQPRGEPDQIYVHKIGMGKPLGMGAVEIDQLQLWLTDRENRRYRSLFANGDWETGSEAADGLPYQYAFEEFLLSALNALYPDLGRAVDLPVLAELLEMMKWRGDEPDQTWLDWTRYMEIEHGTGKQNEFKERPVLPSPVEVVRWSTRQPVVETGQQSSPQKEHEVPPSKKSWPPEKGDVLIGEVIDVEPGGKVLMLVTGAEELAANNWINRHSAESDVVAEIHPRYLADKTIRNAFREGAKRRHIIVLSAHEDKNGWLIQGRPVN